ncbi:MAG: hypothetical protein JXR95_05675 [Deltaproteobacteria bacterium]|nr:hypothetical protein [Deltaproteobacteria bacterium]
MPYLKHSKTVAGESFGFTLGATLGKRKYSIGFYTWNLRTGDGNYLNAGSSYDSTNYIHFSNTALNVIHLNIYENWKIGRNLEFLLRGGLGAGILSGSIRYSTASGCTSQNIDDSTTSTIWTGGCYHNPTTFKDMDFPPVLPIVSLGAIIQWNLKNLSFRYETGLIIPGVFQFSISVVFRY